MVEKEITRVEKGGKMGLKESKGRCLENIFAKHVFQKQLQEVNVRFRKRNNKLICQVIAKKADLT